jgi:hypothetical protein
MRYTFGSPRSLAFFFGLALAGVGLAACNGGSASGNSALGSVPGNVLPPAVSSRTVLPNTLTPLGPIITSPGAVNGENYLFRPKRGNYPDGGRGQTVDGVPCLPQMSNDFHVHAYLGIVYNGQLIAVPHAVGMVHPGLQVNGWTNSADCFYEIHTHDSSGIIHMEVAKFLPLTTAYYHLKNVFDVWGVPYGSDYFGPFHGPIHVFVGNVPLKQLTVSSYREYVRRPETIPLRSHEVIWLEIGQQYFTASQLPSVRFYMEY